MPSPLSFLAKAVVPRVPFTGDRTAQDGLAVVEAFSEGVEHDKNVTWTVSRLTDAIPVLCMCYHNHESHH